MREHSPEVITKTHAALGARLALAGMRSFSHRDKQRLLDELQRRHETVPDLFAGGRLDLAYEVMYGISLGLDGLSRRWGPPKSSMDETDMD